MGGKSFKSNLAKQFLHPKEEERILAFFGLQNTNDKISAENLKEQWQTMLVPSFLEQLVNYLVKLSKTTDANIIKIDAMLLVYLTFVRGTLEEIAAAIADLIGSTIKSDKEVVVSYNSVLKYLCDLISSYLKLLENGKDKYLMSWSVRSRKFDTASLSAVVNAWCVELVHKDDEGIWGQFGSWGLWLDYQFSVGECTTFRDYVMPATSKKFTIECVEIWGVGDPLPTQPRMGEKVSSVLDRDSTLTQMLEMMGRKLYSKGLRESPGPVNAMLTSSQDDFENNSDES